MFVENAIRHIQYLDCFHTVCIAGVIKERLERHHAAGFGKGAWKALVRLSSLIVVIVDPASIPVSQQQHVWFWCFIAASVMERGQARNVQFTLKWEVLIVLKREAREQMCCLCGPVCYCKAAVLVLQAYIYIYTYLCILIYL